MPGVAHALQAVAQKRHSGSAGYFAREKFRLIKTALSEPIGVKRHGDHGIGGRQALQRGNRDHAAQWFGHAARAGVLQTMDGFAQPAFIQPGHGHCVEPGRRVVERVRPEARAALPAEERAEPTALHAAVRKQEIEQVIEPGWRTHALCTVSAAQKIRRCLTGQSLSLYTTVSSRTLIERHNSGAYT